VVFVSLPAAPELLPRWTPLAAALLGVGAHLLNVLPDLGDDEYRRPWTAAPDRRAAAPRRGHDGAGRWDPGRRAGCRHHRTSSLAALVLVGLLAALQLRGRVPFVAAIGIA
jgi:hypothetical protein